MYEAKRSNRSSQYPLNLCAGLCRHRRKRDTQSSRVISYQQWTNTCDFTPTGGAKSVRLLLKENWEEELPDEELCSFLASACEDQ